MNILFINGSPHKNGNTVKIMKEIEINLTEQHSIEWVHCYSLDMKPCIACLKCRPESACKMKVDDAHHAAELIRNADQIIIGSPTYFGNITGPLKILIDRSVTSFENVDPSGLVIPTPLHTGKKAALVSVCAIPHPYSDSASHGGGVINALRNVINTAGYTEVGNIILGNSVLTKVLPEEIKNVAKDIAKQLSRA